MTAKDIIRKAMGEKFTDALYEGTTEETLSKNFNDALNEISRIISEKGTITIVDASDILVKHNPSKQFRPELFVGYASAGNNKLNHENLMKFESDYFSVPSRYPHQRFGQALSNKFELPKNLSDEIFYETDTSLVRSIIWTEVQGVKE